MKAKHNRTGEVVEVVLRDGKAHFDGKSMGLKKFVGMYTKIA